MSDAFAAFVAKSKAAGLSDAAIAAFKSNYDQLVAGVTGLVRAAVLLLELSLALGRWGGTFPDLVHEGTPAAPDPAGRVTGDWVEAGDSNSWERRAPRSEICSARAEIPHPLHLKSRSRAGVPLRVLQVPETDIDAVAELPKLSDMPDPDQASAKVGGAAAAAHSRASVCAAVARSPQAT